MKGRTQRFLAARMADWLNDEGFETSVICYSGAWGVEVKHPRISVDGIRNAILVRTTGRVDLCKVSQGRVIEIHDKDTNPYRAVSQLMELEKAKSKG